VGSMSRFLGNVAEQRIDVLRRQQTTDEPHAISGRRVARNPAASISTSCTNTWNKWPQKASHQTTRVKTGQERVKTGPERVGRSCHESTTCVTGAAADCRDRRAPDAR
jgi:hypothetical protein